MVCRDSRFSSAFVTFARGASGMEDNQILSLNHALMREGAQAEAPTREEWNSFIDRTVGYHEQGLLVAAPGTRNIRGRLEAARSEVPSGPRYYAARRLMDRVERTQRAHETYLADYASRRGITTAQARERFQEHFTAASDDAALHAGASFAAGFRSTDERQYLLRDRRSTYAYEQMEGEASTAFEANAVPSVTRERVNSTAVREIGYDADTGRVEVVMNANPDRVYAYRMTPTEWQEFRSAPSIGSYYARRVRGNSDYHFESNADDANTATRQRCPSCGEWVGRAGHACPPAGSDEARNRDTREAVARRRGQQPEPATPVVRGGRTRAHVVDSDLGRGAMRLPTRSRLQQEARSNGTVEGAVAAVYRSADGSETATVMGNVQVEYLGRGRGYQVSAVTEPGDSGVRHLRCSCAEYARTYHCPHVDETVARASAVLRGDNMDSGAMRTAIDNADASLRADAVTAADLNAQASAGWRPAGTNMEENPEEFQSLYEEARLARAAYKEAVEAGESPEYPVPYMTDNAFGGLASRESGRGFGVEIEFTFPNDMTYAQMRDARARIGRQLRQAGLTSSSVQAGYGSSHGAYRTEHAGGWSYESDPTVNGGEIVSPVMFDDQETWTNLQKVCDILKENGADPAGRGAGMHVHVGVGEYDHDVANHTRLLAVSQENEDLLYRMSINQDRGNHRGLGYCAPNQATTGPYTSIQSARSMNTGHHLAVNLQSVAGRDRDHVEFRTFDGTLNPAVMQGQIGMAVYMSAAGSREGSIDVRAAERHPLGERVNANPNRRNLTGDEWNGSTKGIRRFIDRYVPGDAGAAAKDTPRIRQMVSMFAMTKWVRRGSTW